VLTDKVLGTHFRRPAACNKKKTRNQSSASSLQNESAEAYVINEETTKTLIRESTTVIGHLRN
jgi:hypothetical protein